MKSVLFLFPVKQIFDAEVDRVWPEDEEAFRKKYFEVLNGCLDLRYRKKGFEINFAVYRDSAIANEVDVYPEDKIVETDVDYETAIEDSHGNFEMPDFDDLVSKIKNNEHLRVCGFHMFSCVDLAAKAAYKQGIDVMVDEDLTNFLTFYVHLEKKIELDSFPGLNPRQEYSKYGASGRQYFKEFMDARKAPWYYKDY